MFKTYEVAASVEGNLDNAVKIDCIYYLGTFLSFVVKQLTYT